MSLSPQIQAIGLSLIAAIAVAGAANWSSRAATKRTVSILAADARAFQSGLDRYVAANSATLATSTLTGPVAVTPATLVTGNFLSPDVAYPTVQGATKVGCVYRDAGGHVTSMSTAYGGTPLQRGAAVSAAVEIGYPGFYVQPDGVTLTGAGRSISASPCNSIIPFAANQVVTRPVLDAAGDQTSTRLNRFDVPGHPEETTMSADLRSGGFDATGFRDLRATRDVLAGGDIVATGYIQPLLQKSEGDACVTTGAANDIGGLARDATGKPLYCDSATAQFRAIAAGGGSYRTTCTTEAGGLAYVLGNACAPAACQAGETELRTSSCSYSNRFDNCPPSGCWMYTITCERWCGR